MEKAYLLVGFVFLLFVAGCSGGSSDEEGDLNYIQGSEGLEISFIDGVPPNVIYQDDTLHLGLSIKNKGAYDLPPGKGKVLIEGYDRSIVRGLSVSRGPGGDYFAQGAYIQGFSGDGTLVGRGLYNEDGDEVVYEFRSDPLDVLPTPRYRFSVVAYACYEYRTQATANVCLDPAPHKTDVDKPCMTQSLSLGTQGAPVAVSSVDVDTIGPTKARLVFTIQNVGNGDVVDFTRMPECPGALNPGDLGLLDVHVSSATQEIVCNGNYGGNTVRLGTSGTAKVVCNVDIAPDSISSYMSAFYVTVNYAYRENTRRDIEIHATRDITRS